jgi:hypothetical protein
MIAAINYDFDQLIADDFAYIERQAVIAEEEEKAMVEMLNFQYGEFAETPMFAQL